MATTTLTTPHLGLAAITPPKTRKAVHVSLWTVQALLAALFLFAGAMKLTMPLAALEQQAHMSGLFLRFIGGCEFLGALGLILPGIFRVRTGLTALAASGLVIIMIGATVVTIASQSAAMAVMPFVVGAFAMAAAYGRWRVVPLGGATR